MRGMALELYRSGEYARVIELLDFFVPADFELAGSTATLSAYC